MPLLNGKETCINHKYHKVYQAKIPHKLTITLKNCAADTVNIHRSELRNA